MRGLRIIFMIVLLIAVVAGGGLLAFRMMRGKADEPFEIKAGIQGVKSGGGIFLYAARTPDGAVLFDTGADPQARPVDALLARTGVDRNQVREVFITHGHFDHIQGAPALGNAKIHLGLGDVGLAAGTTAPEAIATKLLTLGLHGPPVKVTDPIVDKQTFALAGGKSVIAIPVPGHTPGSYAFLYDGVLFTGDIMVFKEGRLEPTPAVFDANPEQNRAAIRSLKTHLVADPVDMVCTAHGGCTPRGLGRNLLDDLISRVGG